MEKYFGAQIKRLWRLLPLVFCVMALLFASVYLIYQGLVTQWSESDELKKLSVAIVGTTDPMLQAGIDAMASLDSSNMSLEFISMDEQTAKQKLQKGDISAYVVFPDDFLNRALQGVIEPIRFISAPGSENILSLVKDELTASLANILLTSEYGAFAMGDALKDLGYDGRFQTDHMNNMAYTFIAQVLQRDSVYSVEELGISGGLKFDEYMICGLSVVFLFLMTLPFVAVFVKEEPSMERLLKSRGVGAISQTVCELGAYILFLLLLSALLLPVFGAFSLKGILHLIPLVFCIGAVSYLIYNLSRDLVSGVLLQMVVAVAMCFVSGCFYPVYFFPLSVQNLAKFLPAAVAREHLSVLLTQQEPAGSGAILAATGAVCLLACLLIRCLRIKGVKEGAR